MRNPNCECIICKKSLYRRPYELTSTRFVCCRGCRSEAYKKYPSENSLANLELGREKGTNHLNGIPKSKLSNEKRSKSHKDWCSRNLDKVAQRGLKTRRDKHYKWLGGISKLNIAIRLLTEYRKWQRSIKKRDKACIYCNSVLSLESHHLIELRIIIENNQLNNVDDARNCQDLWDINNGITLCKKCHYLIHDRKYPENGEFINVNK